MLNEEVEKYTELTGEDGWKTPIIKIRSYLDGYDKGQTDMFEILQRCCKHSYFTFDEDSHCSGYNYCKLKGFDCVCTFKNCPNIEKDC